MKKILAVLAACTLTSTAFAICPAIQSGHFSSSGSVLTVTLPCAYPDTNYAVTIGGSVLVTLGSKTNSTFKLIGNPTTGSQYYGMSGDWIAVQD